MNSYKNTLSKLEHRKRSSRINSEEGKITIEFLDIIYAGVTVVGGCTLTGAQVGGAVGGPAGAQVGAAVGATIGTAGFAGGVYFYYSKKMRGPRVNFVLA